MGDYYFYFDESFHTRRITKGSLSDTRYFNSYISTGLGFKKSKKNYTLIKYKELEKKYIDLFSTDELKSTVIPKKNYKSGIASFNKNAILMYKDYFSFLYNYDVLYHISVCDKLEYLLLQCKMDVPFFVNKKAMIYSIVKIINVYKPQDVIDDILKRRNTLHEDLLDFFKTQLKINGDIKLKELENAAMKNCILFLERIDPITIVYDFDYSFTYQGFYRMVSQLELSNINLIIDKEGTGKIVKSAKLMGFVNSIQRDSKKSPGVRAADLFCGFISRMMMAIYEATYHDSEKTYINKYLIPREWFDINENQFALYKSVAMYIKKYINNYYGSFVSIYFDLFTEFIGIIYYFDNFSNFIEYKQSNLDSHYVNCNNILINRIGTDIKRLEHNF